MDWESIADQIISQMRAQRVRQVGIDWFQANNIPIQSIDDLRNAEPFIRNLVDNTSTVRVDREGMTNRRPLLDIDFDF